MSVHFPDAARRAQLAEEHGANLSLWLDLPEDKRGVITGTLPNLPPPTSPSSTAKRYQNRLDGKHKAPDHKRKSANPKPPKRSDVCSTCGSAFATILFNGNKQYCGGKCVPFNDSSEASPNG